MILGFTGTRQGLSVRQKFGLGIALPVVPDQLVHGGAVGADTEFDQWFRRAAWSTILSVDIFPADEERRQFWLRKYGIELPWLTIHQAMLPLDRNELIVQRCNHLLACPFEPTEQLRGGTWATVRYARKLGRPITLLLPDGTIKRESVP